MGRATAQAKTSSRREYSLKDTPLGERYIIWPRLNVLHRCCEKPHFPKLAKRGAGTVLGRWARLFSTDGDVILSYGRAQET